MFEAWKEKRRKDKEAAWLAEIRARDAELGVPTKAMISDRLATAAIGGMWDVVDDCLQKGATLDQQIRISRNWDSSRYCRAYVKADSEGYQHPEVPLLCVAVMHNRMAAVKNLLAQGANVDSFYRREYGAGTPLYLAVKLNNPEMVKLLCDHGASLVHEGPLRLAEQENYKDIIKIIRAEEAKRALNKGKPLPVPPPTDAEKVMGTLEKLSDEERAKLLAAVNEKFAPPQPDAAGRQQGIAVQKPLTLKKKA